MSELQIVKVIKPNKQGKLTKDGLDACLDLIRRQYLGDGRPWVIGYSGGKDSTCVLQLVWNALLMIPAEKRNKRVYVIASNTLVETPAIERHLASSIDTIRASARNQELPIEASAVRPTIDQSFWVNLIGRGYPAPYSRFRWCTDRMKIEPATKFIKEKIAEYGEVVVLLGARKAESSTRAQVMSHRREISSHLFHHSSLANAWVFTPIEDWASDDVWTYLTSTPSPWGADNRELITMYRNAQAGECPLVIDKTTPSCGGGRFGCWVCTVVERDRTMEALIDNGDVWLQPLLDFRNWLSETKDPSKKSEIRVARRRVGRIEFFESEGQTKLRYGPFTLDFRKQILERLLMTQSEIRKLGPDPTVKLIQDGEILRIRQLWLHEEGDWGDSLPAIFEGITGERLEWALEDFSGMGGAEKRVLEEVCEEFGLPVDLLVGLLDVEREYHGMSRRSGIYAGLEKVLKKDWRSLDQAWAAHKNSSGKRPSDEKVHAN